MRKKKSRLQFLNNDHLSEEPRSSLFSAIFPSTFSIDPLYMTHGPREQDTFISKALTRVISSSCCILSNRVFLAVEYTGLDVEIVGYS